jgi:hypothetical protein
MTFDQLWAVAKVIPSPISNFLLLLAIVGLVVLQHQLAGLRLQITSIVGRIDTFFVVLGAQEPQHDAHGTEISKLPPAETTKPGGEAR